jgi:hypothetical protein
VPANANAIAPDGAADCEGGQQGYPNAGNPFTQLQDKNYKHVVVDVDHDETVEGPTYDRLDANGKGVGFGAARVPEGFTFAPKPDGKGLKPEPVP